MINIIYTTIGFILLDLILSFLNLKGIYYLNHAIANSAIVYYTIPDVIYCYTNYDIIEDRHKNYDAINMVFSLHLYHMTYYIKKLKFDDWLHHIIMILFALPFSLYFNIGAIISHALFFLSGLPGGIDYFLLFMARNNMLEKMTEKRVNNYINLWVRCPGALYSSNLILLYTSNNYQKYSYLTIITSFLIYLSVYWNGIYYMNRVVVDYNIKKLKNK